jgi:hypothetical protein
MKVYIGPYTNWIGPYQIADKIFFWLDHKGIFADDDRRLNRWDYKLHDKFGDFLANTWISSFCNWMESRKERKIEIRIDRYDTWSMDHTLALIILPMLKQLDATKHGAPFVEDEDVPDELKSTSAPPKENEWETDEYHFKRWDWVLSEMIWAFQQKVDDTEDDSDDCWEPYAEGEKVVGFDWEKEEDIRKRGKLNMDKYQAKQQRLTNAFTLFGKYYQGLWD